MTPKVEKLTFIGGQMPTDLADELKNLADRNDRPVSAELRQAVRAHVSAHQKPNGKREEAS